ncbi:MAG: pheT phenylalanyl-tRNA synthetase beta subunit, partial [Candidatus Parcubacteria bacterium]
MRISYNWLQDYFDTKLPSAKEIAEKITFHAFEIESVEEIGGHFNNVVVGKVLKKEKHPNADRLSVCVVDVGDGGRTIVCGAANVAEGQTVAVALPGAVLPGDFAIKVSKIRGVESNGMICSERELGFTKEAEGIWVIEKEVKPGTLLKEFLQIETDHILDIKVLPDRAHDCLSHSGIAREISALFSIPLKKIDQTLDLPQSNTLNISIDSHLSKRYMGALIRGVKVAESPLWLQTRLKALGQKPINNIVDITNYVMLDIGQPLHAFDLARLSSKNDTYSIEVKKSKSGEKYKALDGVEYVLPSNSILITDGNTETILGIAGIKGGEASAVTPHTVDILLEAAHFDSAHIRLASQALKLRTESSVRFEKEISPELVKTGLIRALKLITELSHGKVEVVSDVYPDPQKTKTISLGGEDLKNTLGINVPKEKVVSILESLGCVVVSHEESFDVTIPPVRLDLEIKENLIEEV